MQTPPSSLSLQPLHEERTFPDMHGINTTDLFLALIILTCLVLALVLLLLLNHCIKRHKRTPPEPEGRDTEAGTESIPIEEALHPSISELHHPCYNEQQRLSNLTAVAPSIELLPEIRTSSERAEDWLERRDSRFVTGDVRLKCPKAYKILGVKSEGQLKWGWMGDKVRAVSRGGERDYVEVKRDGRNGQVNDSAVTKP